MATKQQLTTAGLVILVTAILGGIAYTVFDTGEELTCRTNIPTGWVIDNTITIEGIDYYEAYCPYKTKDWLYATCSSFRSTGSYERYGCDEVVITSEEIDNTPELTFEERRINALNELGTDCNPTCNCDGIRCYGETRDVVI